MNMETLTNEMDIFQDDEFSFDGYQVVRGEFFAHVYEPSFTFNSYKCSVNTACIKKLPNYDYVQILVNPDERKLAVRPCSEDEKDSFRWCSATSKRAPKQITCRMFFAKVITLMDWNPDYRYKLLGKLIQSGDDLLFVFDLNTPEIYKRTLKDDGKVKTSRTPVFPEEWKDQFGMPVTEHRKTMQINTFDGYAVFGLQDDLKKSGQTAKTDSASTTSAPIQLTSVAEESEEPSYEQLSITNIDGNQLMQPATNTGI